MAAAAAECSGGVGGSRTSVKSCLETMPMRSKGGSVLGRASWRSRATEIEAATTKGGRIGTFTVAGMLAG